MTNKQALRDAAEKAGAEVWCAFIDTKSKTYAVHTPDDDRCGDVVKWLGLDGQQRAAAKARFIAAANPATVLALLDELEAAEELAELQRFKLERQAEDLHQAKSLESIHREKRYEVEREFSSYKERAENNTRRLAQEVCRLEDEMQAAGIRINGEG